MIFTREGLKTRYKDMQIKCLFEVKKHNWKNKKHFVFLLEDKTGMLFKGNCDEKGHGACVISGCTVFTPNLNEENAIINELQAENERLRQALEKAASDVWNSLAWLPTNPIDCKANLEGTRESILKALKGGE